MNMMGAVNQPLRLLAIFTVASSLLMISSSSSSNTQNVLSDNYLGSDETQFSLDGETGNATCLFLKQSISRDDETLPDNADQLFQHGISNFCQKEPGNTIIIVPHDWSFFLLNECQHTSPQNFNPSSLTTTFKKIYTNLPSQRFPFDDSVSSFSGKFADFLLEIQSSEAFIERMYGLQFWKDYLGIDVFTKDNFKAVVVVTHVDAEAAEKFAELFNAKFIAKRLPKLQTSNSAASKLTISSVDCSSNSPFFANLLMRSPRTPRRLQAAPPTTWENKATKFQITLWSSVVLVIILLLTLRAALALGNVRDPILRSKMSGLSQ